MPRASFQAAGTAVATTTTSLSLVVPTVLPNDIIIATIISNNNTAVVAPQGYTKIQEVANTAAMQSYVGWKRAGIDDSGATHVWTVAGTTLSFGVLTTYRSATTNGNPIGDSTASNNAVSDNVTYASLQPRGVNLILACGTYNLNSTTAGAFSGSNPTFTLRVDVETATGNTASIFVHDGPSLDSAATGSRTLATASVVDAINQGFLFELLGSGESGFGGGVKDGSVNYPRLVRSRSPA